MGTNLDYLNPDLAPLEQKAAAYLEVEEQLRRLAVETHNDEAGNAALGANSGTQPAPNLQQQEATLRSELDQLREDLIQLLPTRDEWVKINLGYGPSRVGAFRLDHPDEGQPSYMIRIVH